MAYVLLIMIMSYHGNTVTSQKIPGYNSLKNCEEARDTLLKQDSKRFDIEAICVKGS